MPPKNVVKDRWVPSSPCRTEFHSNQITPGSLEAAAFDRIRFIHTEFQRIYLLLRTSCSYVNFPHIRILTKNCEEGRYNLSSNVSPLIKYFLSIHCSPRKPTKGQLVLNFRGLPSWRLSNQVRRTLVSRRDRKNGHVWRLMVISLRYWIERRASQVSPTIIGIRLYLKHIPPSHPLRATTGGNSGKEPLLPLLLNFHHIDGKP